MKRYLPFIIIAGVLVLALGVGVAMWRSSQQNETPSQPFAQGSPAPTPSQPAAGAKTPVTQPVQNAPITEHARGGANAKAIIEEFGDYQCPPCGALFHDLKTVEKEYGDQMRFVFRHFPLQGHKHALTAAYAAEAAGRQGRFWEMHDMIYQNQLSWSPVSDARPIFTQYASSLGLDIDRFTRDMSDPQIAAKVRADYERGVALKVEGTPTVFINGRQLNPNAVTSDGIRLALDIVLGKKK